MFAILLFGVLGFGAILAAVAMASTWREYGSAWQALATQRAETQPVRQRYLTIRVIGNERGFVAAPAYAIASEFRTRSVPVRRAAV